jgi:hypothetical protein
MEFILESIENLELTQIQREELKQLFSNPIASGRKRKKMRMNKGFKIAISTNRPL